MSKKCKIVVYFLLAILAMEITFSYERENFLTKIKTEILPKIIENAKIYEIENNIAQVDNVETIFEGLYGYCNLNEKQQNAYRKIYRSLVNYEKKLVLEVKSLEELDGIFRVIMRDFPDIFYVDGYQYQKWNRIDGGILVQFQGLYNMSQPQMQDTSLRIEAEAEKILEKTKKLEDDYSKIKYVYEYLIYNTQYDEKEPNHQNICSVFLTHKSVCQGYAKAMQYLLQRMGIESYLVTGIANQEEHAWNLVKCDDDYYYIDLTWGDASYSGKHDENVLTETFPNINYDYFMVTTSMIESSHRYDVTENYVQMPRCDSLKNHYFHKEGKYLEEWKLDCFLTMLEKSDFEETGYFSFQCKDEKVYQEALEDLIEQRNLLRYLGMQERTIAYAENKELNIISFWLSGI